jgi:hypothetical protein
MAARRVELEIRTVVVSWRAVMRQIRAGYIPESRESVQRISRRALAALDNIERSHAGDPMMLVLVREARSEVHGATDHDLADSREQAG